MDELFLISLLTFFERLDNLGMKNKKIIWVAVASSLLLMGCDEGENASLTSSDTSSDAISADVNYRYLRADLISLRDYDAIGMTSVKPTYEFSYKDATISTGIFGDKDPYFAYVASEESSLEVVPASEVTYFSSLKSDSFKDLKAENHIKKATVTAKNVPASSLTLDGKEFEVDSYLKDGVFYAKPNDTGYKFIKYGIALGMFKYGNGTSDVEFPKNGAKITLSDDKIKEIDGSGLLPVSDTLSTLFPALLSNILNSDIETKGTYEKYAGKPRYTFAVTIDDVAGTLLEDIDLLDSFFDEIAEKEGEDGQKIVDSLKENVKPLLSAVDDSQIDVSVVYDQDKISSFSYDMNISFDESKMKDYLLSMDNVEEGSSAIPLSIAAKKEIALDFSQTHDISFPDFSSYEELDFSNK